MTERRTMKRGDVYSIEEKNECGDWVSVGECNTIDEAKELLATLKVLNEEDKDE